MHNSDCALLLGSIAVICPEQPFFQVALPIVVTFAIVASWYQSHRITDLRDGLSKRMDDLRDSVNRRLEAIDKRLERIETLVDEHDRRITTLEERTSPLRR